MRKTALRQVLFFSSLVSSSSWAIGTRLKLSTCIIILEIMKKYLQKIIDLAIF